MRLIDAETLVEYIKAWDIGNGIGHTQADIIDAVNSQPIGFDVDEVVERLEKLKKAEQDRSDNCDESGCCDSEEIYDDGRSQGRFETYEKAIGIVKEGGVSYENH